MITIVILLVAVAAGAACGLARLKISAVALTTVIFLIIAVVEDSITGLGVWTIALTLLIGTTFLQLFYLIGWALLEEEEKPAPGRITLRPELVRAMQTAIGQELRMSYPLPQDLPPQLRIRVDQLKATCE